MTASGTEPSPPTVAPPPDGIDGTVGWLMVVATLVATFVIFGVAYSFGTFVSAMAEEFDAGNGATAFMFGLTIFFLFSLSVVTGRWADRVGPRPVVIVGAATLGAGLLATSWVHHLWLGYVTYGLGIGVAVACCYVPMVSQVSGWFDRRRAIALGVAVSGIGLGTLIGPPVAAQLIDAMGWRATYRLFAAIGTVTLLAVAVVCRRAPAATGAAALPLRRLFAIATFRRLYGAGLLMGLSLFVPFVFLVPYAKDRGIAAGTAAWLVSLLGVGSVGGRLVLGTLGSRLGVMRLYQVACTVMGGSFLIWLIAGSSLLLMGTFAVVLGVSYGGYVALSPAVCAHLFGLSGLGAVIGALYTSSGIGGLVGPYLAGRVIDITGSYAIAIGVALALASGATALLWSIGSGAEPAGR
ncbi:MAG: MFS transporter [Acidimicrobiales bacterium]|nr:MFS transporter [Acidimicrobiales bacterium]